MQPRRTITTLAAASAFAVAAVTGAMAHDPGAARQGGPPITGYPHAGMMHHGMGAYGMMGQGMVGRGMMGGAYGPGPMGPGYGHHPMPGMGYGMGPNTLPGGPSYGPGPMGPGYGHHPMGPGMGRGMAPGMTPGMNGDELLSLPEDLTPGQVRHMFEHRLEWHGNPNIRVGEVTEADEDSIIVEIVTQEGSLVQRFAVDRHTGLFHPAQQPSQ